MLSRFCDTEKEAPKSSEFRRLEKEIGDGYKSVIEFHIVVNGNRYYVEHEERPDGHDGWLGKRYMVSKSESEELYNKLLNRGYVFTGLYEMDIFGRKELIFN